MHELSIAQALVEQVAAVVAREGGTRARRVTVKVGALSGVDAEALEMAFPVASERSACDGATLLIEPVAAAAHCRDCGRDTEPPFPFLVCEHCGSTQVDVLAGHELLLASVEIETDHPR